MKKAALALVVFLITCAATAQTPLFQVVSGNENHQQMVARTGFMPLGARENFGAGFCSYDRFMDRIDELNPLHAATGFRQIRVGSVFNFPTECLAVPLRFYDDAVNLAIAPTVQIVPAQNVSWLEASAHWIVDALETTAQLVSNAENQLIAVAGLIQILPRFLMLTLLAVFAVLVAWPRRTRRDELKEPTPEKVDPQPTNTSALSESAAPARTQDAFAQSPEAWDREGSDFAGVFALPQN